MRNEKREARRLQIEKAAYALLKEKGHKSTSMLAVAKRAGASNETLYRWYGSKQALFSAMVRTNAGKAEDLVRSFEQDGLTPLQTLERLGPILLRVVTGEQAVSLNRAAAGDVHETATLGGLIAQNGKQTILPLLTDVFRRAGADGLLQIADPEDVADVYISLLIGDLQIERVIGVRGVMTDDEIEARANRAYHLTRQLYATGNADGA